MYVLTPSFVKIFQKMTQLCCFNQANPHLSAFPALSLPVMCWWLWKEPVCWWWDEGADLEMDRALPQMKMLKYQQVTGRGILFMFTLSRGQNLKKI